MLYCSLWLPRGWQLCGQGCQISKHLHLLWTPSTPPTSTLHSSRNLPRMVSGVTCNQSFCLACRICRVPEPSEPRPQPASKQAWCYRHEDNGSAGLKAFQSPTFSRKGCVVRRKGHSCRWFMFSQASIPHKQLCLYKTRGEGQRERKDSVLGMTSLCLVCFTSPHCRREGWRAVEVAAADWWTCLVRVFIRACVYYIYNFPALRSAPSPLTAEYPNTFSRTVFPGTAPSEEG